jgi:LmbE family N-acetylglucosaminyl deacetylase
MRRGVVACVFAHPDDEAFCPSGTIAKLAKSNDVYILCATRGEAGEHDIVTTALLPAQRQKELIESAMILGVKQVFFLDFEDGTLSNNLYHKLANKIETILQEIKPDTLLTFEMRGLSGHIDHIVVSLVTTFVFERLSYITKIMYFCSNADLPRPEKYFIYYPPGYKRSEVDEVVDVSEEWDAKVRAIQVHKSQQKDMERVLARIEKGPKEELFLIRKK